MVKTGGADLDDFPCHGAASDDSKRVADAHDA